MKTKEFLCTVKSNIQITPTVYHFTFEPTNEGGPFLFKPGQFISVIIPGAGPHGRDLRRGYSIASPPEMSSVDLCIKFLDSGPGSTYLCTLKPGDQFKAIAPFGHFLYESKKNRKVCFVATGTGIAPFRAMILSKTYLNCRAEQILCLLGVRTENEIIYEKDFIRFSELKWIPAVTQPTPEYAGFKGRVTDYLRTAQGIAWQDTDFYLCGNGDMIKEAQSLLEKHGVPKEAIFREKYY